jgi:hypothetical protein
LRRAIKLQRRAIKGNQVAKKNNQGAGKRRLSEERSEDYTEYNRQQQLYKKTLGKSGEEQTLSRQTRKQQRKEMVFCIFHPI